RTTYTEADGLSANEARAILESRDGDLLVGTLGGGLNRLSFPPWEGETPSNPDLPPSLETAVPTTGIQGSAGASPSRGRVKPRVTVYSTAHGLSNDRVTSLLEEPDGTLWIGTRHGLNRLKNGRIAALTTAHGLPDNWINSILDDDLGDLWFSSERGVFHARKEDLHFCADGLLNSVRCVVYDESEGLLTRLTNGAKSQPAGWKCRDGTLWFATPQGVAVIDPNRAKLYETAPRVVIEQVKANSEIVYDNAGGGGSQGSVGASSSRPPREGETLSGADFSSPSVMTVRAAEIHGSAGASPSRAPIRLAPGSGDVLEFHYTAPTFIAPERARFRHRLEGFQTNWVDAGTRRQAYYTNLRPGTYRFQVIACNHSGIWSQTGASFAFYLTPHFYQIRGFQPFCWLLAVCLFGVIVFFLRRFHALQQAKERQEHALERAQVIEEERSRISRDLHEDLATGLTRIGLLSQQITAAGARAPKVPEMIAHESSEMIGKLQELVWVTNPKFDSLDCLVAHLRETTAGYLSESGLAVRLDFPRDVPAQPVSAILRREIALVLREMLNNIVKHASATEVGVQLRLIPKTSPSSDVPLGQLEITVMDNGCGFDASKPTGSLHPFGGNGLGNMRHRMNSLGGDLSVESAPGQGTRVVTRAPLCGHSGG
ncbi:MAG: hypothetical protein HY735_04180, partial [Verrucomicrobia bacterium]|nr:hypothetical protein [Verrucomicrobiota bacterium]